MLQVLFPILTHLPYILLVTFFCSFVFGIGSKKNFGLPNLVSIVLIVTGVFMMIIPSLFWRTCRLFLSKQIECMM